MKDFPMDQIILEKIEVEALIGCLDEEKDAKQLLYVDLCLHGNFRRACEQDELEGTVDYAVVVQELRCFSAAFEGNTIEHYAHCFALLLKEKFLLERVDVCVDKPRYTKTLGLEGIKVRVSR